MRILGTILLKPFPFLGSHVGGPSSFTALRGPLPPGPQPPWKESCISCLSYIAVRLFLNIVAWNFMPQNKKQRDLPWFQVPPQGHHSCFGLSISAPTPSWWPARQGIVCAMVLLEPMIASSFHQTESIGGFWKWHVFWYPSSTDQLWNLDQVSNLCLP